MDSAQYQHLTYQNLLRRYQYSTISLLHAKVNSNDFQKVYIFNSL